MSKHFARKVVSLLTLLTLNCVAAFPAGAQTRYLITNLGTLGEPGTYSTPTAINRDGVIVGNVLDPGRYYRAFIWENGVMTDLGTLPDTQLIYANGVNSSKQVVGVDNVIVQYGSRSLAYAWQGGLFTGLPDLGGANNSGNDINDSGQVAGTCDSQSFRPYPVARAVLWSNGSITDLGTLPGDDAAVARAINASGQTVGISYVHGYRQNHAFLYDPQQGSMVGLGNLGGGVSEAFDVNDAGQVVGTSTDAAGNTRAFLWSGGVMTDLGTLGGLASDATGINNRGEIVGRATTDSSPDASAYIYRDGVMTDLRPLILNGEGWAILNIWAINDRGQIIGDGVTNGERRAFLLSPAEPTGDADLSVINRAPNKPVLPGAQITYTIKVTNNGPDNALAVTLADDLPQGTSFVSCAATGGVCAGTGNSRTVTFNSLPAGATETATIVVAVDGAFTKRLVVNTATVSAFTPDSNTANNSSTETVKVRRRRH